LVMFQLEIRCPASMTEYGDLVQDILLNRLQVKLIYSVLVPSAREAHLIPSSNQFCNGVKMCCYDIGDSQSLKRNN